jgi:hypothetical protein
MRVLLIALVALILVPVQSAQAQMDFGFDFSKSGTAGMQFVKIGMGAREAALGEAAIAMTNDANSVFWNIGALPMIRGPQASFTHNQWLAGSTVDAAVVATPLGPYAVSLSVMRLGIEEFEETTVMDPDGTGRMVSAGNMMVGLGAGRRFTDRLTIGVQVKYVRETLDTDAFDNVLFDIGTVYYTGLRNMRLAFSLQHFGPDVTALRQRFRMPLIFRMGVADDFVNNGLFRLTAAAELVHPTDNVEWVNLGLETEIFETLSLRGGYRFNVDEGALSLGGGLNTPQIGGVDLRMDYAWVPFGDVFGATHRISFLVSL